MPDKNQLFKISELQYQARQRFKQAGIATADLDARILLCHVCEIAEPEVIAYPERPVDDGLAAKYFEQVDKRAQRIPLAHLLGSKEFWGLEFFVNAQTLIPRPETEFAVELSVERAKQIVEKTGRARILDLGTGTGCLLISILHEVEGAEGIGIDINPGAVKLAKQNARRLSVEDRAVFQCGDWGEGLSPPFDMIVSNPPYVRTGDLADLMPEVAEYEPVKALDGGADGLAEYRRIIPLAQRLLSCQGVLIMEIGESQAGDVLNILEQFRFQPDNHQHPVKRDLAGYDRIVSSVKVC